MKLKRICPWCKRSFSPHPRLGTRQKCCGDAACRKKQKALSHSRWIARNKKVYKDGQRDWRQSHSDYWKNYRASHPAYVTNNRLQSRARKAMSISKIGLQNNPDRFFLFSLPKSAHAEFKPKNNP